MLHLNFVENAEFEVVTQLAIMKPCWQGWSFTHSLSYFPQPHFLRKCHCIELLCNLYSSIPESDIDSDLSWMPLD